MIKRNSYKYFLLLALAFSFGFLSRPLINRLIRKVHRDSETILINLKTQLQAISSTNNSKCSIQSINKLQTNSIAIIGHAYGSHYGSKRRGNVSFSPNLKKFFDKNKKHLDIIIFSGDILKEPSLRKWEKFFSYFGPRISIYIAPGNHDVGNYEDSSLRDVFNQTMYKNKIPNQYPFYFINKKSLFIIDDSNTKVSNIKKIESIILSNKELENIYIIRHHVLSLSLKQSANGTSLNPYLSDQYFKNIQFKDSAKKLTFIYGDGGAFPHQTRIDCLNIGNTRHIVNGIGEQPGDTLLIIRNNQIFRKEI